MESRSAVVSVGIDPMISVQAALEGKPLVGGVSLWKKLSMWVLVLSCNKLKPDTSHDDIRIKLLKTLDSTNSINVDKCH